MSNLRKVIHHTLVQLANSQEVKHYLNLYRDEDPLKFAVIKVGGGIIEENLEVLSSALSTICHLGLVPVVIHGAGSQLDCALQSSGVVAPKIDGMRVTTEAVMSIARPIVYRLNRKFVAQLNKDGVEAVGIQHGVFECSFLDRKKYGLVGRVEKIDLDGIREAAAEGTIPIISCFGETTAGQVVNVNADVAARELILALKPKKIIFLTPTGGLLNQNQEMISSISLLSDFENLVKQPWVHSGMRLKLQQIRNLLAQLSSTSSVSITSADHLLRELFTHKGAGTLINQGEPFLTLTTLSKLQQKKLAVLIEDVFDQELEEDYFDQHDILSVFTTHDYKAAAVIVRGMDGIAYLDKFVVSQDAQGFGHAGTMWRMVKQHFPQLYWRSRVSNEIASWYFTKADVSYRQGAWFGFCYGLENVAQRDQCLQDALQRSSYWKGERNEKI